MGGRFWIVCGALLADLAVVAGARAHGLKPQVETKLVDAHRLEDYETAVRNHTIHAIALVFVGLVGRGRNPSWMIHFAGAAFLAGMLLFCGGLYAYALSDNRASWAPLRSAEFCSWSAGWRWRSRLGTGQGERNEFRSTIAAMHRAPATRRFADYASSGQAIR